MHNFTSRTFQSPHQLQQHVRAAFLPPPRGNGVWNQYPPLCSPELPAGGLARLSRETSPTTSSVSTQLLSQVKTRGGSQRQQGGQRTSAHRAPTLPSTTPLCHRNGDLWNPLFSLLHGSQEDSKFLFWPHFLDQKYFLGFFFQP